ncbi:MAG: hypothetical protein K2N28_10185 [Muribaculaceae bacterium]|nr:hypothetical protein [Muribaculaceae bacterium]
MFEATPLTIAELLPSLAWLDTVPHQPSICAPVISPESTLTQPAGRPTVYEYDIMTIPGQTIRLTPGI